MEVDAIEVIVEREVMTAFANSYYYGVCGDARVACIKCGDYEKSSFVETVHSPVAV